MSITLLPSGRVVPARPGATLLAVVLGAGMPIGYSCRGRGVCIACRLRVEGEVEPPDDVEQGLIARIAEPGPWRIACLARVAGDATVQADYW